MKEEQCILCGQAYPAGLQIMGCLICFPCEKRILWNAYAPRRLRGLRRLYGDAVEYPRAAKG